MDGQTVAVALIALCGACLALVWQVSRLADRVDEVQEDMHATARWIARMEAYRLRDAGRQKDGDGDEDQRRDTQMVR